LQHSLSTKVSQSLSPDNTTKYPIWPLGLYLGNMWASSRSQDLQCNADIHL